MRGKPAFVTVAVAVAVGGLVCLWRPGVAAADLGPRGCAPGELRTATVATSLELRVKDGGLAGAVSRVEVKIPRRWPHAADLLRDGSDVRRNAALRCLLAQAPDQEPSLPEPTISVGPRRIVVVSDRRADLLVESAALDIGFWRIRTDVEGWRLEFAGSGMKPAGLTRARWASVRLSAPGFVVGRVSPLPTRTLGEQSLRWERGAQKKGPPRISVTVRSAVSTDPHACAPEAMRAATVTTSLRVGSRDVDLANAASRVEVRVPRQWPYAADLLRDPFDARSSRAVRCLIGAIAALGDPPFHRPRVEVRPDTIVVIDDQHRGMAEQADEAAPSRIGPWRVESHSGRWTFTLVGPDTQSAGQPGQPTVQSTGLAESRWRSVDLSVSGFTVGEVWPLPSRAFGSQSFRWEQGTQEKGPPAISVTFRPGWAVRGYFWARSDRHRVLVAGIALLADVLPYTLIFIGIPLLLSRRPAGHEKTAISVLRWSLFTIVAFDILSFGLAVTRTSLEQSHLWMPFVFAFAVSAFLLWYRRLPGLVLRVVLFVVLGAMVLAIWGMYLLAERTTPSNMLSTGYRVDFTTNDYLAIAAAVLTGILAVTAITGLISKLICDASSVRAYPRDRLFKWATNSMLALIPVAVVLMCVQPIQFALFMRGIYQPQAWLADSQISIIWPEFAAYPGHLIDMLTPHLWPLIVFTILVMLRVRCAGGDGSELTTADCALLAVLFMTGLVWWPNVYAGISIPLAALVVFWCLFLAVRPSVKPRNDHDNCDIAPADRVTIIREYRELEVSARRLDRQLSSGEDDTAGHRKQADANKKKLARLRRMANLPEDSAGGPSPLDVVLNCGPNTTWWANGTLAARYASVFSVPAAGYLVWYSWHGGTGWDTYNGWFGPFQIAVQVLEEALFWFIAGFVLGCLWRELPGRRGFLKPVLPVAAYGLGVGADYFVARIFGQEPTSGYLARTLALFVVLTVVGVLLDLRTLAPQRTPWASKYAPLIRVYRIGAINSTLAIVLAQIAAIIGLWLQLKGGVDISSTTPAPAP